MKTKAAEQRRSHRHRNSRFHLFTTVSLIAITFFTYMFNRNTFISNVSFNFNPKTTTIPIPTNLFNNQTFTIQNPVLIVKELIIQEPQQLQETVNDNLTTNFQRIRKPEFFDILNSNQEFESRTDEFLQRCEVRFFMTWIVSPFKFFGDREFLAVDALFKSNPDSCLMILSNTMDSDYGFQILKPVIDLGFRVLAIEPDFDFLFDSTPAKAWFDHIRNGNRDPGGIPLAQNLSNLIRLVVLYKYGGVYLDTDFVPLQDFSGLRNAIGAQSATRLGNWTRLNNAVLVFDKNHPLLYDFIEEFASTFDGNRWGHNGPYLVSRVVERNTLKTEFLNTNFTVLPPSAFYPVDWTRIGGLFRRPVNRGHARWVEAKVVQLKERSYGVHLWNKQSRRLRIEEESIMAKLVSQHCVVCKIFNRSQKAF
ncbi:hypothetical protein SSX86_007379 [Deinandra increscens subsp. villosa]|uniref:Alpha 1,4-glycosyltransferase domain-containing protein n=1 Tax=Deinandra increscens subsp. villosa TaxID=3103831 RepID=A0AAP0DHY3_9ASTR